MSKSIRGDRDAIEAKERTDETMSKSIRVDGDAIEAKEGM
jgi:hypothetical protein